MSKPIKCSICKEDILPNAIGWDQGHNADPINSGRCCDHCNDYEVIPARMRQMVEYQR